MSKVLVPQYKPKPKVATDPRSFATLEEREAQFNDIQSFPPEYIDYINFMNTHESRQPSYNPRMMDKHHLKKLADEGRIGYSYMEKDFDNDGHKDVLVWGKRGLKAYNGITLKNAKWKPDRDFYAAQTEPIPYGKGNKGKLRERRLGYNEEAYGVPTPDYNRFGVMQNWMPFKTARDALQDRYLDKSGQPFNHGLKRKPKAKALRNIFGELAVEPVIKAIKEAQTGSEKFSFDLKQYNAILSELYGKDYLLGSGKFEFGNSEHMTAYLNGELSDKDPAQRKIKSHMVKALNNARVPILTQMYSDAPQLQQRAVDYIVSLLPQELRNDNSFKAAFNNLHASKARAALVKYDASMQAMEEQGFID